MRLRSETEWRNWIEKLERRQPDKKRYVRFYKALDDSVPNWMSIIVSPSFLPWGMETDPETGSCMMEMLYALWNDPAWQAEQFATIIRLFERDSESGIAHRRGIANVIHRLFGNTSESGETPHSNLLSGRYEVLRKLGSGGNGDVFLAWSRETHSLYGLKVMKSDLRDDRDAVNRFKNEIETWVKFGAHPNIVRAFFLDVVNDTLYITMEYIEGDVTGGPSLTEKLQKGGIDGNKVSTWFAQVADGLHHAYSCGIASHRDIKPGNILIARDGTAKITDFGLVAPLRDFGDVLSSGVSGNWSDTAPGSLLGTPLYMSPEQFCDASRCDQRSDIYSLGITLYQTVSGGRLPFLPPTPRHPSARYVGRFLHEVRSMHERAQPPRLHSPFWPVIEKCLAKRPSGRFADISEFREAIRVAAKGNKFLISRKEELEDDIWAYRDRGNTLLRLGKYEEAISAFDAFYARIPDDSALFNKAVCLENLGRINEAMELYEKFIKQGDYKACVNGANCLRKLGDHASAMELAYRATQLDPEDSDCWIALGNVEYAMGIFQDAIVSYQHAVAVSPSNPTPHYNLALARKQVGDMDGAARSLKRFLSSSPALDNRRTVASKTATACWYEKFIKQGDYKACVNGANCLRKLGDHASAMELAYRATQLDPEDSDCWIALGNVEYAMGIFQDAIVSYQHAVAVSPSNPTPHYNLALARKQVGDMDGAARSLKRFLSSSPALDNRRTVASKMLDEIAPDKGAAPRFD